MKYFCCGFLDNKPKFTCLFSTVINIVADRMSLEVSVQARFYEEAYGIIKIDLRVHSLSQ